MLTTFAVLAASVSVGGSIRGMVAVPVLSKLGLPGAGLPSSVRRKILPSGWLGSWAGVKRWRSPTVRNRYWPSGEKAICPPSWPPLPLGNWCHSTVKFCSLAEGAVTVSLARARPIDWGRTTHQDLLSLLGHQPNGPDLFGDQHAAVGQEGQPPGQFKCA